MAYAIITYSDGTNESVALEERKTLDGFSVSLSREMIKKPAEYVDFMPDYAPAYEGEEGYFVFNNRMVHFMGHEDAKLDTGYLIMPFFGVKTPRICYAAIFTGLWEQHTVIIERKNGVYTAHSRFNLEGQEAPSDMQVDFHMLLGDQADYSGMAAVYRAYQLNRGACTKIRDKMNEHLAYLLDAPEVRVRLGWKPAPPLVLEQTRENEPPMHVAVDFGRMEALLDACKKAGVDKAEFCLVGWNVSGHDGRWPEAFPVDERLGGEERLKKLIQKAKDMGYKMVCHTNATDCYSIADCWHEELPIRARDGSMATHSAYSGGTMYDMCPKSSEEISVETLKRVRKLGFEGLHYIDVISTIAPRRCFSSIHPCTQAEYIAAMRRLAKKSKELFGGFQSEGCYDYLGDDLDMGLYADFHMTDSKLPLVDDNVPMWQMVYHDVMLHNPGTLTVNYPCKDWMSRLKFFEYGGHPSIYIHSKFLKGNYWMGNEDYTAESPEAMERSAQGIFKALEDYRLVKPLQLQAMMRHERKGNLAIVTYEQGDQLVCNYGEAAIDYRGASVPPHDFVII